mgnify:CR=1 FL=1
MEFTACGTSIGYLLTGAVNADDPELAFSEVTRRVERSLEHGRSAGIEIVLWESEREIGRRVVHIEGRNERRQSSCR